MDATGLDHAVVVVREIDAARANYKRVFGAAVGPVVQDEGYLCCSVKLGSERIELCEPVEPTDAAKAQAFRAFAAALASRGEGLHCIAVRVPDVEAAADELERAGVPVVSSALSKTFFVHPAALNGVLVQFVGEDADGRQGGRGR